MKKLLMGMSAWGSHIDRFLQYGLPSLMSEGNIRALSKEYDIAMHVHTDRAGTMRFAQTGLPFIIHCDVTDEDKYRQLGRHQHKDLRRAKDDGADYHLLMPDFVYSEDCFSGIMRAVAKGHKAIARLCLSTTMETICPYLRTYLSAADLATLSVQHVHKGIKHWFVTNGDYPNTHVLAWEGENTLHLCSPHCSPVYIANEVIKIDNSNATLDCIPDKIIDGDIYCPKPEDGIVVIEISPENSREPNDKRIDLKEFVRIFKADTNESKRQLEIFDQETIDPINRSALGTKFFNDVEISVKKSTVMKNLRGE